LDALHEAYGHRCVYCDHNPGRTIDHASPKRGDPSLTYVWANWRVSCGDCNNRKGTASVVDPHRADPSDFFLMDVLTGKPLPRPNARPRTRDRATITIDKLGLDNQIYNDARRRIRQQFLKALRDYVDTGEDGARETVLTMLSHSTPHRAVLRELMLERDRSLNPWRPLIDACLARLPQLEAWARAPLAETDG